MMDTEYNDRGEFPSASAVARLMRCAASHHMGILAKSWDQMPQDDDPWKNHGTRIHEAIQRQSMADLNDEEERTSYSKLISKLRTLLGAWGAKDDDTILQEHRMWMHNGIIPVFSGQADYIRIQGDRALLVDFKTLWARSAEPAQNKQLISLALLLVLEFPQVNTVTMQILSPHYTYGKHIISAEELDRDMVPELTALLDRVNAKTEPEPGEWCKRCAGILICPAVRKEARDLIKMSPTGELPDELPTWEAAARLLKSVKLMRKLIDGLEKYYKMKLFKEPDSIPGWGLVPGRTLRTIKKPKELMEALTDIDLWPAVSLLIGKVEKLVPKEFDLEPYIKTTQGEPSLGRVKTIEETDVT